MDLNKSVFYKYNINDYFVNLIYNLNKCGYCKLSIFV